MALTLEQSQRIEQIRAKINAGTVTPEEEAEGIAILARDRMEAQKASTKARTDKAIAARSVDTSALLAGIKAKVEQSVQIKGAPLPSGTFKL